MSNIFASTDKSISPMQFCDAARELLDVISEIPHETDMSLKDATLEVFLIATEMKSTLRHESSGRIPSSSIWLSKRVKRDGWARTMALILSTHPNGQLTGLYERFFRLDGKLSENESRRIRNKFWPQCRNRQSPQNQ